MSLTLVGCPGESVGEDGDGETGEDNCESFRGDPISSGAGTGTPLGRIGLLPTVYGVCGGIELSRGCAKDDRG